MAYEYKEDIENAIIGSHEYLEGAAFDELDSVYRKAKAMDEIEQAYWKSNTPENFAYEFVGIFEEHFSNDMKDE